MFIVSQILVIIGMIIDLIGKAQKNKKLILLFLVVANVFYVLSYVFMQNPLASITNGISLVRYVWYFEYTKKQKKFKSYILPIILLNGIYIVLFVFFAREPLDILLLITMLIASVGFALAKVNLVRFSILAIAILWAVYNYLHGAYANMICDFANISITIGALIYYNCNKISKEKDMKTIVLASGNKHKIKEIQEMFSQNEKTKYFKIIPMNDIGFDQDIEETGETFEQNAKIKADAILNFCKQKGFGYAVMSDDSGLCVDALDGKPGVYSARYAGEPVNYQANRDKLLAELNGKENRDAHFVCCIVLKSNNGKEIVVEGKTDGKILTEETGNKEFCYDCLFYSNDLKKSFGESTEQEKNSVSHRGRAVKNLIEKL